MAKEGMAERHFPYVAKRTESSACPLFGAAWEEQ